MFWDIPSWLLRMHLGELAGAVAYTLLFALIESALIAAPIIILGFLIPSALRLDRYLSLSFVLLFITAITAILVHNYSQLWLNMRFVAAAWLLAVALLAAIILRFPRIRSLIARFAHRLRSLINLYLVADLFAIGIVVARNL